MRTTTFLALVMSLGCSERTLEPAAQDFTQEVEQICERYCVMNLDCREPPAFASAQECEQECLNLAYFYNDSDCGQAKREMMECIGSTTTCEGFNDTYNVQAELYTCQAQKDHYASLACGQSGEAPRPEEQP